MPRVWAVVPAAGCGERFGDDCPKQFSTIQGHTLISFTISSLLACAEIEKIIVVTSDQSRVGTLPFWWRDRSESDQGVELSLGKTNDKFAKGGDSEQASELLPEHRVTLDKQEEISSWPLEQRVHYVAGSTSRHRSIRCGLDAIAQLIQESAQGLAPDVVLVHDGVRPLVPAGLVTALVAAAAADGAAGLTRPLVSTVLGAAAGRLGRSLDRARHRASETPQAFAYSVITRAYQQCSDHELDHGTECLQLALTHAGVAARLLDGPPDLWKVTYRRDLHAFRGVVDDERVRLAVVSTPDLENLRDSLVSRLSPRLPRVTALPAADLAAAGCRFSSLVLLRPQTPSEGAAVPEQAALRLNRHRPGHVVEVRLGPADPAGPADTPGGPVDAEAERCLQRTGKWLCRVDCAGRPTDGGRRLAALLTSVLLSEEAAFHGQTLRA